MAKNLYSGDEEKTFFVWVDPENFLVQHNAGRIGSFTGGPLPGFRGKSKLWFVPDPEFRGVLSPFHNNIIRTYLAEYNLELARADQDSSYPSRLDALFLFDSVEEAEKYRQTHEWHVADRVLKKVRSAGPYTYSTHDGAWVDFLRLPYDMEEKTLAMAGSSYWTGRSCAEADFLPQQWRPASHIEVLFYGQVDFENTDLTQSDVSVGTAR